jgi:hypothetical protein
MKKPTKTRVTTVTCSKCATETYSRTRHDYHLCECGGTMVDGGFDYLRYGSDPGYARPLIRIRYVNATRKELYDDWNTHEEKFGVFVKKGV